MFDRRDSDACPRRARIIATLGPASGTPEKIEALLHAGVNVFRLNFSHGEHAEHAERIQQIRESARRLERSVAVLQDLQGPKIRTGLLAHGPVTLETGAPFTLSTREVPGGGTGVSTSYLSLPQDVRPGHRLLLDDGRISLKVEATSPTEVQCLVLQGGELRAHAGINLPDSEVSAPSVTEKDRVDLAFGLEHGVDWIALSFVRRPEDVMELKDLLAASGRDVPVVAKIEKPQAVERLEEILEVADAVMVARGDLGVEMPIEEVALTQKHIIRLANQALVPVITATQMLETMTHNQMPTRAEATDVANAILDGTDALMLSGETAIGDYPVETVAMMVRIIEETERSFLPAWPTEHRFCENETVPFAVCGAARLAAQEVKARLIVGFSQSGFTARLLSKARPSCPTVVFTPVEDSYRRMALLWGVVPKLLRRIENVEELVSEVDRRLVAEGLARAGEIVILVAGSPIGVRGTTNLLKVHHVGAG